MSTDLTQHEMKDKMQTQYETMLMEYAAGVLDEAQSLVMGAHASLSPYARRMLKKYECLGGAMLSAHCEPISMKKDALDCVMAQLDQKRAETKDEQTSAQPCHFEGVSLPSCLKDYLDQPSWQNIYPGMAIQNIETSCLKSKARLLKVDPGVKTPEHSHRGVEMTLMLDGAFHDESGTYSRGDLIIVDEDYTHQPIADERTGCICLVVTTAPIKLTGWKRLFNPFLK